MTLFGILLRSSRGTLAIASIGAIASGIVNTALLAIIQTALTQPGQHGELLALFVGMSVLLLALRTASQVVILRLAYDALLELRMRLVKQLLATPLARLEQLGPSRLLGALTDDVAVISANLPAFSATLANATILIGCLAYLAWVHLPLFGLVLGAIVVGGLIYQTPQSLAIAAFRDARTDLDNMYEHFRDLIAGVKELQLHTARRAGFLEVALGETERRFRRNSVKGFSIFVVASAWGQSLFLIGIGVLLFLMPKLVSVGSGVLVTFVVVLLYAASPLESLMGLFPALGRSRVAARSIETLALSLDDEPNAPPSADVAPLCEMELRGVTYTHPAADVEGEPFVCGPVDLRLRRGELVFIVGDNGSGKTTLAKMITGLYLPSEGSVLADGQEIDPASSSFRNHLCAIFADSHLFDRLYGMPDTNASAAAIDGHLRRFNLHGKVHIQEGVIPTKSLSQGQRRRVMLIVALLEDRPFYVLDEWAAEQDPAYRRAFYLEILPALRSEGKCVVCVSHDDRFFGVADRIVRMEKGKVVAVEDQSSVAAAG